ncbi:hypothetical protein SSP35_60_00020 [Streptomyces sp. NBRC 110611]|uniref:DUF3472 domain-containing protein n=1 Tax=Streptomyces sp. NBRC 110611 TaxID=1621259 RepID=UPI00085727AD|nr:ricin-type beta-trefoil lectin domain protein [Streptomyces sp. NBRC 110611]GAU71628.1 hypothetical protein SSP35_60_00020 [Streptomyces sp. NBRC 110611]
MAVGAGVRCVGRLVRVVAGTVFAAAAMGLVGQMEPTSAAAVTDIGADPAPRASLTQQTPTEQTRIVAGGMATDEREWPFRPGGYSDFETSITITRDPGYNGRTYWAHQFGFSGSEEPGYVGLQSRDGYEKFINFSIWGAASWSNVQSGTRCRKFDHEGSGVQCDARYVWREGVTYRIKISRSSANSWRAAITDTRTGKTTDVATIVLPQDRGGLSTLGEWVENFAQGSDQPSTCEDVPAATVVFGQPTASQGRVRPIRSSSYTYGNCSYIAKAVCTTDHVCTLTVNQGSLPRRAKLQNTYSKYCLDMLGGGASAGLWHCETSPNQLISQGTDYRLHLSAQGLCLQPDAQGMVKSASCNNSAEQQWMYLPQSSAYFNAGKGKCLDPLNNAELSAPLSVYDCLENAYQRWQPIS